MSTYSITNPSEQALRLLITAGGGEETLLLQSAEQELRAQVSLEAAGAKLVASLHIDYLKIRQHFTTRNYNHDDYTIDMTLVDGPFEQLSGGWRFIPPAAAFSPARAPPWATSSAIPGRSAPARPRGCSGARRRAAAARR